MDATPARVTEVIDAVLSSHADRPGALLPMLHAIQDALGYVPAEAVPKLAHALNQSRAEIHGVLTYYPDFRQSPPPRHVVRICRAEACQSVGANALVRSATQTLGCGLHEHTADHGIGLEPVYCLGQCAIGPNVMIDGELHARVTPERFRELTASLEGS